MLAYFMRIFGAQPRHPKDACYHYSVYILRNLGIARYPNLSPSSKDEHDSSKAALLSNHPAQPQRRNIIEISKENKFEGELHERWAKHILCAHVNLRQARNEEETIEFGSPLYLQRLQGELQNEASYEADIPICAILSTFHKLAQDYEKGNTLSLDNIYEELDRHCQAPRTWTQIWKQMASLIVRQEPTATFKFKSIDPATTTSQTASKDLVDQAEPKGPEGTDVQQETEVELEEELEEELKEKLEEQAELTVESDEESRQPILVFTRTFSLLMGRAHAVPESQRHPWLKRQTMKISGRFVKKDDDEIRPCKKCAEIWKPETTVQ